MIVAGLVLAGCTDRAPAESGDPPPAPSTTPLEEFLGSDALAGQEPTEAERQLHYQVEELVAACMAESGFDYYPEPFWGDRDSAGAGPAEPPDPSLENGASAEEVWQLQRDDPEAFARQYGYGITTFGTPMVDPQPEPDPSDNPNWEYQQSLSPAALDEYQKALWGDWDTVLEEETAAPAEDGPQRITAGGCRAEAAEQVFGLEEMFAEADQFQGLWDDLAVLEQRILDDPRLAEVTRTWSACMAVAGYPELPGLGDGQVEVGQRLADLYGVEPDPAAEEEAEPREPEPAELADLREFELAIAWADFTCRAEHRVAGVEREVRVDLEEQFIEDHRPELEAYRDWRNEQSGG